MRVEERSGSGWIGFSSRTNHERLLSNPCIDVRFQAPTIVTVTWSEILLAFILRDIGSDMANHSAPEYLRALTIAHLSSAVASRQPDMMHYGDLCLPFQAPHLAPTHDSHFRYDYPSQPKVRSPSFVLYAWDSHVLIMARM